MKRIMGLQVVLVISLLFYNVALAQKPSDVPNYRAIPLKALDSCIAECGEPPDAEDLDASERYQLCVADCHPKIDLLNQSVDDLQYQIDNYDFQWSGQLPVEVRDTSFCDGTNNGTIWFDPSENNRGMQICLESNHIGKFSGGGIKLMEGHLVFVTSQGGTGRLTSTGNVDDIDTICQNYANAGTMTGPLNLTWRALISGSHPNHIRIRLAGIIGLDPIIRVGDPYVLLSSPGYNLFDGAIDAPIKIDENGRDVTTYVGPPGVWTGSNTNGTDNSNLCNNWTSSSVYARGVIGHPYYTDSKWITHSLQTCNNTYRLYCISEETVEVDVNY